MSEIIIKEKQINNEKNKNEIFLQGNVITEPIFDHEINGKKFYSFEMQIGRENSKAYDILPIYCEEEFLRYVKVNNRLAIVGKLVVRIDRSGEKKQESIKIKMLGLADFKGNTSDINEFNFEGYIVKKYPKRTVLAKDHTVIDIKIMTKFLSNKNIFNCNAWDNLADKIEDIEIDEFVSGSGRLQKRNFISNKKDGEKETKIIYEVCLKSFSKKSKKK